MTARSAGLAALLALLAVLPVAAPQVVVVQTTDILIFALFALSLNLLVGYAGMLSLGHAAFFAIGGYSAGLLVKHLGFAMPLALAAAPLLAAAAAGGMGFFCVRLSHAYFIMLSLAFGQLVFTVIWKWRSLTGGDDGLTGIMPLAALVQPSAYYYFVLAVVLACTAALYRIGQSPFGRALLAIKDNPRRAAFLGIHIRRMQLAAFVVAAAFAGVAGGLQVFFHRGMFPGSAHWLTSADAFVAVTLGGFTEYWLFFLGIVILIVALVRPQGLVSLVRR
jgi:branched-chain amino acid transport system permease protein